MKPFVMGMDIGGTNTRALAMSMDAEIIGTRVRVESQKGSGPEAFIQHLAEVVIKAAPDSSLAGLQAIGIGMPGPLNPKEGVVYQTPHFEGFLNVPVAESLSKILKVPVYLEHDANCAALGEHRFGVAQGKQDFLMLTFGTGIGGGIFMDGKLRHGKSGGSGEIGHLCLYPRGLKCPCGRQGCFEEYLSANAVLRRARAAGQPIEFAHQIYEACDRQEPWAQELIEEISFDLSIALGSLINIFEPEAIVLGGGLFVQKYEAFLEMVRGKLKGQAFASALRNFNLHVSAIPGNAGLMGAAALALNITSGAKSEL